MGFTDIFSSLDIFSLYFFNEAASETATPPPATTTWYNQLWLAILEIILTFWDYRLYFLRDITLLVVVAMIIYMFYSIVMKQRDSTGTTKSASTTTV